MGCDDARRPCASRGGRRGLSRQEYAAENMPQFKSGGDRRGDQPGDQLGDLFDRIANSEAAIDIRRAIRDAVAVAVREAEERVNNSWESAWAEQKRQLRYERSRARLLGERMRSA